MYADLKINGLDETEKTVNEILFHVSEIKKAAGKLGLSPVSVEVELKSDAVSGN